MNDYKPNSHRFKEEQKEPSVEKKQIQKVVSGTVKTKKKSGLSKFIDNFVSEDVGSIKQYVIFDILVPAIKDAIYDVGKGALDAVFYGEKGRPSKSTASKVSYRSYYDKGSSSSRPSTNRTLTGYSYDNIVLESRAEAEEVLSRMDELIDMYGVVAVADLYDLVGITGNYTDNKYGWTNIRNAKVTRVRDGYLIELPKALPLN